MAIYGNPIMFGGGNGDCTWIHADFPSSTTSYSLTKSGKSYTPVYTTSTTAVYSVAETGTYTLTISNGTQTKTATTVVSNMYLSQHVIALFDLESVSWTDIARYSKIANPSTLWSIGATKVAKINNVNYTLAIMGFGNYDVVDPDSYGAYKNAITLGMVDCMNTTYAMDTTTQTRHNWGNSSLRTNCNKFSIESELKNILVYCNIPYTESRSSGSLSYDTGSKLFIPSYAEVFGTAYYEYAPSADEGSQFAYYANGGSKIKKVSGSDTTWWLRSVKSGATTDNDVFVAVNGSGAARVTRCTIDIGVSLCCCI